MIARHLERNCLYEYVISAVCTQPRSYRFVRRVYCRRSNIPNTFRSRLPRRTPSEDKKHVKRLLLKDNAKRAKLAALGIDYDFPGFAATIKDREVAKGPFQGLQTRKDKEDGKVRP